MLFGEVGKFIIKCKWKVVHKCVSLATLVQVKRLKYSSLEVVERKKFVHKPVSLEGVQVKTFVESVEEYKWKCELKVFQRSV